MTHQRSSRPQGRPVGVRLSDGRTVSTLAVHPRLSVSQMTTHHRAAFEDDVVAYKEAGLGAIGLWRRKLNDFGIEAAIDCLQEHDLHVSSVNWIGGFTGTCGHRWSDAIDEAKEVIADAGRLGAECVTVVSGPEELLTPKHARRIFRDALEVLAECAEQHQVTLAVVPMNKRLYRRTWTFLDSLDETVELLSAIDHPRVQMAFGTYHLWEEPNLIERIPEIANRVALVQISDWKKSTQSDNDGALPGEGCIPIAEILAALHGADYRGYYEINVWSEDVWRADTQEVLEKCCRSFAELHCPDHPPSDSRP